MRLKWFRHFLERESEKSRIKKVHEVYISPHCWQNFMKLGVRGQVTDIITCVKFLVNRFRGYGVLTPQIPISHRLAVSPLQQCTHCRATSWQETLLVRWSMAKEIKADEAAVCMAMKPGNERHNLRVGRVCWSQLFAECVWVIRLVVRFTIALLFMSFCPFCRAQSPWFFFLRTKFPDVGTLKFFPQE